MSNTISNTRNPAIFKLVLASMLIAVAVAASPIHIPIGAAKCFPVQHLVNVLAAVFLGRWYGTGMAVASSTIRVILGTGSLLAFPGSIFGALLSGLLYHYTKKLHFAYIGEVVGTGFIGSLVAYPVAAFLMGKTATVFFLVGPFLASTLLGTIIAAILVSALRKTTIFGQLNGGPAGK